ncbi:hypothetical protein ACEWK1_06495 [Metabacillus sp. YM-086]|uniref:hypothetical protein n=1 Tax=Metabacillus sp. YM-086 TaxID=3341729 RepID=UPI003A8B9E0F
MKSKLVVIGLICILMLSACSNKKEEVMKKESVTTNEEAVTLQQTGTEEDVEENEDTPEAALYTGDTILPAKLSYENENWLLYTNGNHLFTENKQDRNKKYFVDEVTEEYDKIWSVTSDGDWVYYLKGSTLWKAKKDGKERAEIVFSDEQEHNITNFILYQDTIYFISLESFPGNATKELLFSMKTDGSDVKVLFDSPSEILIGDLNIANETLYFTTNYMKDSFTVDALHKLDLKEGQMSKVFEANALGDMQIYRNELYFIENNRLFKSNIDGTNKVQAISPECVSFAIYNDQIFIKQVEDLGIGADERSVDGMDISPVIADIYSPTSEELLSFQLVDGDYVLHSQSVFYTEPKKEQETATEGGDYYESEAFYQEIYKLYDELLETHRGEISISTLEDEESKRLTGGNQYFLTGHILGSTKTLLYGLTNQNADMLSRIVSNPGMLDQLLAYEAAFRFPSDHEGGYYDYTVEVEGNKVHVKNSSVEADINFEKIGDSYYFKDMKVSKVMIDTN